MHICVDYGAAEILAVEDDPCARELLAIIFKREDYDVIESRMVPKRCLGWAGIN